jgi:mannose-6-phosphate isomerase-like protein (cupin superfamily)
MPDSPLDGWPTRATDDFAVVAPDGIVVHPIPLPGLFGLTLAEGRLPPGEFAVHAHRSLEQITYVLAGRLLVTMGDPANGETVEFACGPGDTIGTPSLITLSFRNPGPEIARVLYICAPPYPTDDADTATLDDHRTLTVPELDVAAARVQTSRTNAAAHFAALAARIVVLRDAR